MNFKTPSLRLWYIRTRVELNLYNCERMAFNWIVGKMIGSLLDNDLATTRVGKEGKRIGKATSNYPRA
jgi:hypothetical protein